ncbi:MAG: acylphosphatase [Nitrospiraceae bacterium]
MSTDTRVRAVIVVSGLVQGVGYRAFVRGEAVRLGLAGGVQNLDDGRVEAEVEGDRMTVDAFMGALRTGPRLARVEAFQVTWAPPAGLDDGFEIRY